MAEEKRKSSTKKSTNTSNKKTTKTKKSTTAKKTTNTKKKTTTAKKTTNTKKKTTTVKKKTTNTKKKTTTVKKKTAIEEPTIKEIKEEFKSIDLSYFIDEENRNKEKEKAKEERIQARIEKRRKANNRKFYGSLILLGIVSIVLIVLIVIGSSLINLNSNKMKEDAIKLIDKINNGAIIDKYMNYAVEEKGDLYDSIKSYLGDTIKNTNAINNIYKEEKLINILNLENKDFKAKREYIDSITKINSDNIKALKERDISKYNYYLKDNDMKEFKDIFDNHKIDIDFYNERSRVIDNNISYLKSIFEFLEKNNTSYDIKDKKIIINNRNTFNSLNVIKGTNLFVKELDYELIKDTTGPVISASDTSVTVGTKLDMNSKIKCTDLVDGEVKCNITGSYNTNKVGSYKLTITASDKSNNKSSKTITITVNAKPTFVKTTKPVYNGKPYYIEVIRNQNIVIVYSKGSDNRYSKVVKTFTVSTGKASSPTPTGTFKTTKGLKWGSLYGGVYGQYSTRITGSILFHSVPYYKKDPSTLEWQEYNKLGTRASAGCVRMRVIDAKWIFDNIPAGTTVKIYDGVIPTGIIKPTYAKISSTSPNKGWDPTDPNSNNPWKK